MTFQNLALLYVAAPALLVLVGLRYWRRHFWGHSLVEHLREGLGGTNPVWRVPRFLEAAALVFLLVALLDPVYPLTLNRVGARRTPDHARAGSVAKHGGTHPGSHRSSHSGLPAHRGHSTARYARHAGQQDGSHQEERARLYKQAAWRRRGDRGFFKSRIPGLACHLRSRERVQYLLMMGTHTLINEGYTAIGEGLGVANRFFERQSEELGQPAKGQVIVLLTDGENNTGRDPMIEIERATSDGTRIYGIGVALRSDASERLAAVIPQTGGKYYDVLSASNLADALTDINEVEKGVFYTLSFTRNEPAYLVFVFLSLACLALRVMLHAFSAVCRDQLTPESRPPTRFTALVRRQETYLVDRLKRMPVRGKVFPEGTQTVPQTCIIGAARASTHVPEEE